MKPIDADALRGKFADVLNSTYTDDYAKVFVAGLYAAMNMPTITPPNEPLTLEQLQEMDGKPVWCKYIGDTTFASRWMIVDCEMNKCSSGEWELPFEDDPDDAYGRTWIAYRCPPEGEKDT